MFYMDPKLTPELKEAIETLKQDKRFNIRYLGDRKIAINGFIINLDFECREVVKCMEWILDKYRYAVEMPREVLPADDSDVAELLKEYPELQAFGVEWVEKWGLLRDRLADIAEALRRYSWMIDVITQRPVHDPHPHLVEVYVALDESETCLLLNRKKTLCNGRETSLALTFSGYDVYDEKIREIYRCCNKKYAKIL
jgi:hypothetical protein